MYDPEYPAWPERWEFFDGILKYTPGDVEMGGEIDVGGIPTVNSTWIVGGSEDEADEEPSPPA